MESDTGFPYSGRPFQFKETPLGPAATVTVDHRASAFNLVAQLIRGTNFESQQDTNTPLDELDPERILSEAVANLYQLGGADAPQLDFTPAELIQAALERVAYLWPQLLSEDEDAASELDEPLRVEAQVFRRHLEIACMALVDHGYRLYAITRGELERTVLSNFWNIGTVIPMEALESTDCPPEVNRRIDQLFPGVFN